MKKRGKEEGGDETKKKSEGRPLAREVERGGRGDASESNWNDRMSICH